MHRKQYEDNRARLKGQHEINKSLIKEAKRYRKLSSKQHDNVLRMVFDCESTDYKEFILVLEYCKGNVHNQITTLSIIWSYVVQKRRVLLCGVVAPYYVDKKVPQLHTAMSELSYCHP